MLTHANLTASASQADPRAVPPARSRIPDDTGGIPAGQRGVLHPQRASGASTGGSSDKEAEAHPGRPLRDP